MVIRYLLEVSKRTLQSSLRPPQTAWILDDKTEALSAGIGSCWKRTVGSVRRCLLPHAAQIILSVTLIVNRIGTVSRALLVRTSLRPLIYRGHMTTAQRRFSDGQL